MARMFLRCVLILSLLFPVTVFAGGDGGYGNYGSKSKPSSSKSANRGVTSEVTRNVVRTIERGGKQCLGLPKVYRYDCYRVVYGQARTLMKGRPGYNDAVKAIGKVEKLLQREVRRNVDRAAPKLAKGQQTFTPVTKEAAPKIKAKAVVALQEAETTLLRSGTSKGTHLTRIAEAVGSNKVLLRTAMLLVPGLRPLLILLA